MTEPTLADVLQRLDGVGNRLTSIEKKLEKLDTIEKQLTARCKAFRRRTAEKLRALDSRFFEFSMRVVSANQSAFYGLKIILLTIFALVVVQKYA